MSYIPSLPVLVAQKGYTYMCTVYMYSLIPERTLDVTRTQAGEKTQGN